MAIEQRYTDLIHADIDGEISSAEKAELDAFLEQSEEGRTVYDETNSLLESLDAMESESPPPHLRHVIMNSVRPTHVDPVSPGFLQALFTSSTFRFAATFTAGVVLALSVVDSSEISSSAFDDVTSLVGTFADPLNAEPQSSIFVDKAKIAGKISLRRSGSMLILDFDLVTKGPVEIQATYTGRTIWFNGFAQLESSGTSVSARAGHITIGMEGHRRYAVFLHNEGGHGTTISLRFIAGGEVIHEANLDYDPAE